MEIITIIFGIIFIIVFLVMASNIRKIKEALREIIMDQKYIVYRTNTDEWVKYTWDQINFNVAYIKCLMFEDGFEVRKKTRSDIDVYGNYDVLKRFNDIEQAKEYYKSIIKKPKL